MSIISEHYGESNEKMYPIKMAAREAGVPEQKIRYAIKTKQLPATSIQSGKVNKYMIAETDLINWMEKRPVVKEDRPGKMSQTRDISDLTVDELAGTFLNKIIDARNEGYKSGLEDGYNKGYSAGYKEGVEACLKAAGLLLEKEVKA